MDNVESRARTVKIWLNIPVGLCMAEVRCLLNRSLESTGRPKYWTCEFHGITACWKWRDVGGTSRRRVNKMSSVFWILV
jgi:hypothetical protein